MELLNKIILFTIIIGLVFLSCSQPKIIRLDDNPYDCSWNQGGGSSTASGYTMINLTGDPELRWKKKTDTPILVEPTAAWGILFVPTTNGKIRLISLKSGNVIGIVQLKDLLLSPCCIQDSLLVANENGRHLVVINWVTNKRVWEVELEGSEIGPLLYSNRVFWQDGRNRIHCYDISEGKRIWDSNLNYPLSSSPVASQDGLIVVGRDGTIECLSIDSGNRVWIKKDQSRIRNSAIIVEKHVIYAASDGHVAKLNIANGENEWQVDLGGTIVAPIASDGQGIFVGTSSYHLIKLDFNSGQTLWDLPVNGPVKGGVLIAGDFAIYVSLNRRIYFVDKNEGKIRLEFPTQGMLSTRPVACTNRIYVAGEDNNIYCFQLSDGK
jgi:outer membrane protein assembly factor BamB